MGNVLQQKEPCPHTNIVEHSVGQASSRKLQASMHGKQSDAARLKRKNCGLTLCKKSEHKSCKIIHHHTVCFVMGIGQRKQIVRYSAICTLPAELKFVRAE